MRPYERLLRYAAFDTASDSRSETCPSTEKQLIFAQALKEEMIQLGISDVRLEKNGYLYGTIPGNISNYQGPTLGFIAHMDVVDDVPSANIRPQIIERYDGGDILLNRETGVILSPKNFPELARCQGKGLIVTDGTTLLGADDKAGVAEILTLAERLLAHPEIAHGPLKIAFTPDEEIGRGADQFDVAGFGADFAYTLDGGAFGELEYENFNAASLHVEIQGKNIHPGSAKDVMKNALTIAMELERLLPPEKKPEYTQGYEGFLHLTNMTGQVEHCVMDYILRDHDIQKLEAQKESVRRAAVYLNEKYGPETVTCRITDSYRNMAQQVLAHRHLVDNALTAIRQAGGEPQVVAIRGGTDGARLSFMGLPCPNLGTGGGNFHSCLEYCCIEEMDQSVDCMIHLAQLYANEKK